MIEFVEVEFIQVVNSLETLDIFCQITAKCAECLAKLLSQIFEIFIIHPGNHPFEVCSCFLATFDKFAVLVERRLQQDDAYSHAVDGISREAVIIGDIEVFIHCAVIHVKGHFKHILVYAIVLVQLSYKAANFATLLFQKDPSFQVERIFLSHLYIVCDVDVAQ